MVELIVVFPFGNDVNHLVLTRHRGCPRLGNPTEHAADGSCGTTCRTVGSSQPCFGKASAVELAIVTSHRPHKWPLVVIGKGVHMSVAVASHSPAGLRTVVAIVDNAGAIVDIAADGGGTGTTTHTAVLLANALVSIVQQGVADIVHVDIVGFTAIVTATCALVGSDANAFVKPSQTCWHVAFIIKHLFHMGHHILDAFHRETAGKSLKVVISVITFQHAKPVVRIATGHRMGRKFTVVANKKNIFKVAVGIVIDVLDVSLDLGVTIAAGISEAHHRSGSSRLVFPIHKRLHGFHVLGRTDDEHFASILNKRVSGYAFPIVDEPVLVGSLHLR